MLVAELAPSRLVHIRGEVMGCRDPEDDMLLETAVNGNADLLISRDNDLLVMTKIDGVQIVPPEEALTILGGRN